MAIVKLPTYHLIQNLAVLLGQVCLCLLVDWFGNEPAAMRSFRKHAAWYTKGFRGSARLRERLMRVETRDDLEQALSRIDRDEPYPPSALRAKRGKRGGTQTVSLPEGFLDDLEDDTPPGADAEDPASGG